jgi:hypothetical protein
MKTFITLLITTFLLLSPAFAQKSQNGIQHNNTKEKSDFFIENKGQWNSEVMYLARINGMAAWITKAGIVYDYHKIIMDSTEQSEKGRSPQQLKHGKLDDGMDNARIKGHVIKMSYVGANPPDTTIKKKNMTDSLNQPVEIRKPKIDEGDKEEFEGIGKNEGYYNYFIGNDSTKWANFVGLYDEANVKNVYKGIDIRYYFDKGEDGRVGLRYDFIVNPGADISQIKIKLEGADKYSVNQNGELVIETSIGEIKHNKLYTYQVDRDFDMSKLSKEMKNPEFKEKTKVTQVQCSFVINPDGTIGFKADNYDRSKPLIIDPLVWSSF